MPIYMQRKGEHQLETVSEFETRKEAQKMLAEYRLSDPSSEYCLSTRPCKNWED